MVATRRSRSLEVKEEALSCKPDKHSTTSKSRRTETATEEAEVRHSASLRESSPSPCAASRPSRASRSLDTNFQWESPKQSSPQSAGKSIKRKTGEPAFSTGVRRSLRHRSSNFSNLAEKYIEYNGPGIQEKIREMRRNEERPRGSERRERRRRELSDLLAAQGKNLSDVKLYTEPDIYSSVKSRVRVSTRDKLYEEYFTQGISKKKQPELEEESQSEETEGDEDEDDQTNEEEEEEDDDDDEEDEEEGHPYKLRKVREAPKRYMIVREVQRRRPRSLFEDLPCSPARRRRRRAPGTPRQGPFHSRRRRARTQGNSSTSDSSSDDEMKFRKRQHKSMARARNECLPINISSAELNKHSYARERKKIGQSLADIDPMGLDTTVTFSSIGGHSKHIRALKEMVVFPLLYPEIFEKFSVTPPRGCLFYGPPGTGKTLMARALANECSTDGKKVSFFMKKGADCLSKWIGESERQLRVLFDQAYQMRPSIIFFDEIDGLAPVRSSRQDQIHSSIVSTLLALMDGLDNRGEIIVIGATNRIDSIDPALRRPGRFDREFLFPLPDKQAREAILRIHTKSWNPQLKQSFVEHMAAKTVGYCGADMKALCTEAALTALRRRYPQIYKSSEKLQLNVNSISIQASDFYAAVKSIIPTAQRSTSNPGRALLPIVVPLLGSLLQKAVHQLTKLFPALKNKSKLIEVTDVAQEEMRSSEDNIEDEDDYVAVGQFGGIYVGESNTDALLNPIFPLLSGSNNGIVQSQYATLFNRLASVDQSLSTVHRPRFIICGGSQTANGHLTPALLHDMDGLPVHSLDLPTLYGVSARTPEESCAQVFREARRLTPSVIFLPNALQWWLVAPPTVQAALQSLLQDIPSSSQILFLATANCSYSQLPREFAKFFHSDFDEVFEVKVKFTSEQRREFFAPVFLIHSLIPPPASSATVSLEVLPKALAAEPAPLTKEEEEKLEKEEESTLRNLRLFLRDVLMRLERDRRFKIFSKPVDFDEVPDYVEVIKNPMDFSTIQTKIDQHKYQTAEMFLDDIDLICCNALEYNPDRRPGDKLIRHRACAMRDMAHAIIDTDLEPEFDKLCQEVVKSRKRRGVTINKFAPKFYPVLPEHLTVHPITGEITPKSDQQIPNRSVGNSQAEQSLEKTPWKSHAKKPHSTMKPKRKPSPRSRGILASAKKKRKIIQSSEDEDEKVETAISGDNAYDEDESEDQRQQDEGNDESGEEKDVAEILDCHDEDVGTADKKDLSVSFENGMEMEIDIGQDSGKDSLSQQDETLNDNEEAPALSNGYDSDDISQRKGNESCVSKAVNDSVVEGNTESEESTHDGKKEQSVGEVGSQHTDQLVQHEETSLPRQRMTLRSRNRCTSESHPNPEKVNKPPPPPLLVDHKSLINLLEDVVSITESCTLDELERIHASLSRCVAKYRMKYDRTLLIQDFKKEIHFITSFKDKSPQTFTTPL